MDEQIDNFKLVEFNFLNSFDFIQFRPIHFLMGGTAR